MSNLGKQYGIFQNQTSWYVHAGEQNAGELMYLVLGLVGEAGEFADAVKKIVREVGVDNLTGFVHVMERDGVREKLIDELGDTMWYMNKLTMMLDLTHMELRIINTLKLYGRLMARPKSHLMELEWPFTDLTYDEAYRAYGHLLLPDKHKDGV